MRRLRLSPRRALIVIGVLLALLAVPCAVGGTAAARHAAAASAEVRLASQRSRHVVTTALERPAGPAAAAAGGEKAGQGGLCGVPGIGDIGGLLGFCSAGSGLIGLLNNICQPSLPSPEPATSGIDSLVRPPASAIPAPRTMYDEYGMAGQFWAATNLQCSDMTSLIGNNVASVVFDIAKSIDRVTITVYQSAAGEGILGWLTRVVDKLITTLGNAIYFPYLALVVIVGALWLAWQGLIRKRGTRTIEGTIWMVVACAAAIWLIGRPADFTEVGRAVSDGITQTLDVAFAKLPSSGQASCMPVPSTDPQVRPVSSYAYTQGNTIVDSNANELWTVLVCKPWLDGEFGTTAYATSSRGPQTPVNTYARQLLWAQAIALNERPSSTLIQAKQATYAGIAQSIQRRDPGVYPLFQGKQWTTRLEIGLAALFAAVIAGVLVLLISVTLIMLKLGFLLLLVVGPFFLLIGTHPGFGRVVAMRWFEMLVGVLLKQAAVALVLSVLVYAYSLIMGTSDAVLPWAMKIMMIALVTVAVFIYRRPFQHLFAAVGYTAIGSRERAEADLARAGAAAKANALTAASLAIPALASYRPGRFARRNSGQASVLAGGAVAAGAAAGADAPVTGGPAAEQAETLADAAARAAGPEAMAPGGRQVTRAGQPGFADAGRRTGTAAVAADGATARRAPPLNLPARAASPAGTRGLAAALPARPAAARPPAASQQRTPAAAPARSGPVRPSPPGQPAGSPAPRRWPGPALADSDSGDLQRSPGSAPPLRRRGPSRPASGEADEAGQAVPFWLRPK
jgi:hypothetical protein